MSGAAFDARAATFPVVFATGPFAVVRLVPARDLVRAREVRDVPFLLVDRLLVVRDVLFPLVDLLDLERPRADRLLEDRVVCAILDRLSLWSLASLPAARTARAVQITYPASRGFEPRLAGNPPANVQFHTRREGGMAQRKSGSSTKKRSGGSRNKSSKSKSTSKGKSGSSRTRPKRGGNPRKSRVPESRRVSHDDSTKAPRDPTKHGSNGSNGRRSSSRKRRREEFPDYSVFDPNDVPEGPDVLLDVPVVKVDKIDIEVDDLQARVALNAQVRKLLHLRVGAHAGLGQVELKIEGVEAQALLKARLDNVSGILERVLLSLDRNPELLEGVGHAVEEVGGGTGHLLDESGDTLEDVGEGAEKALPEVGKGAESALGDVGKGTNRALGGVGQGAKQALPEVGKGAGQALEGVGQGTQRGVAGVGKGAQRGVEGVGKGAGQGVQGVGQGAGRGLKGVGKGVKGGR